MKKISKKQVFLIGSAAVLLCALILFLIWFLRGTRLSRPADTNLEFWITESVEKSDFSGHEQYYGTFGSEVYLGTGYSFLEDDGSQAFPERYVSYTVTSYPDHAYGKPAVTRIVITDPEVRIYGLTVDSAWEEVNEVMRAHGYRINEDGYTKRGVRIVFREGMITISVEVRNLFSIQF